jgi:hypothetical protein
MMEGLSSSVTSVLTTAAWRNIPEDAILHNHRRENLKSHRVAEHSVQIRTAKKAATEHLTTLRPKQVSYHAED